MPVFCNYLLKVILISAVLFAYYRCFLRNKIFHGYNRFYLLGMLVLSLSLPLLHIDFFHSPATGKTNVIKLLRAVNAGDDFAETIIFRPQKPGISFAEISLTLYILVSIFLFVLLIRMLIRIGALLRRHATIRMGRIHFINTEGAPGTPFSFLHYIFWNRSIDVNSETGKRIFSHELTHVQEHHSLDKLFVNGLLVIFWINPIFWLIRKELNMIHEFAADQRAVAEGGTAAFASMILAAAHPQYYSSLTNSFFYSPIQRRLAMLSKNQHPKMNYVSRLLVLPLAALVFAAFTLKINTSKIPVKPVEAAPQSAGSIPGKNKSVGASPDKNIMVAAFTENPVTVVIDAGHGGKDGGARNEDGTEEKEIALALVKKIKALNTNQNVKIILSREADIYQSPKDKADFALQNNADLFISLHLDGAPKEKQDISSGMSVIIAKDHVQNSNRSRLLASALIGRFKENYGIAVSDLPVQRQTGVWVLDKNRFPSVIIEAGYISNKNDLSYLKSPGGQKTFANNVLNAINDFADNTDFSNNPDQAEQDSLGSYKGQKITGISVIQNNSKSLYIIRLANGKKISLGKQEFNALGLVPPPPPPAPDPVFRAGNLTQSYVKLEDFIKQTKLTLTDGYLFSGAQVYFSGAGFEKIETLWVGDENSTP